MSLKTLLEEKKSAILRRWFDLILEAYPADTQRFLKKQKNRFANPVAHEISLGLEGIFGHLLGEDEPAEVSPLLDKVIRIRAVQEMSPSTALAFIFDLKMVIREALADRVLESPISGELVAFERKIDRLGLLSLDLYMKCREKIAELRIAEVKNRVGRLLEMANLMGKISEPEGDKEAGTDRSLS